MKLIKDTYEALLRKGKSLNIEKRTFCLKARAVAAEGAVGVDDAMAGNKDRKGVCVVRHADGAEGARTAGHAGDIRVGAGFAEGNRAERGPHGKLKGRADRSERHGEGAESPRKVGVELARRLGKHRSVARRNFIVRRSASLSGMISAPF